MSRKVTIASIFSLLAVGLIWLRFQKVVPVELITRDPSEFTDQSPALGLLTGVGILCWAAAAFVTLFASALATGPATRVLVVAGSVSALLCLDDWLRIHDAVIPDVVGVSERITLSVYAALVVFAIATIWPVLAQGLRAGLTLAVLLFAASILFDQVFHAVPVRRVYEDGAKVAGALAWASVSWCMAIDLLRDDLARRDTT